MFQAAAASSAHALLTLSSSKSWYGHAEPGAGMVGIAHALWAQQQQAQLPIMHLRTNNPMVASMLESTAAGGAQGCIFMPRQARPAAQTSLLGGVAARTGVSAFAFQVGLVLFRQEMHPNPSSHLGMHVAASTSGMAMLLPWIKQV